jgi:hypothetical protein
MKYLIKSVNTYRVPTVQDALKLRDELSSLDNVELNSFSYTTKYIKVKGEAVEEYQLVKATIVANEEKEPESNVDAYYEVRF